MTSHFERNSIRQKCGNRGFEPHREQHTLCLRGLEVVESQKRVLFYNGSISFVAPDLGLQ
jgi:hypothetical protein